MRIRLAALAAAVLLVAAGVQGAGRLATVRIGVPEPGNLQYISLWTALGAGYFVDEGLDARVVVAPMPRQTVEMLVSGQVDAALLPPPMYLGVIAEQRPIVLFANLLANDPINVVVRRDVMARLEVRGDSPLIDRIRALRGLRIGVANEPYRRLRVLLAVAGMNLDTDVTMVAIQGEGHVAALADGTVDALYTHTPYLEDAIVRHGARLLIDQSAGEVPELAGGQIHSLAAMRSYAAEHQDVLAGMTRAVARAQRLLHADPDGTEKALINAGITPPTPEHLRTIVRLYRRAVPMTPAVSAAAIERNVRLYPARPSAPDFNRVRAADFLDTFERP